MEDMECPWFKVRFCCGGKTLVFMISLLEHRQFSRHNIIMSAMDKVSNISRDNVSSINHGREEQKRI
jgi:hypothetical protein